MISKWYHKKSRAVALRKRGHSIRDVEKKLKIPRSTLSNWFKDISLNPVLKKRLEERWKKALIKARKKAALWHNKQKAIRLTQAKDQALETLSNIAVHDRNILDLALAMLYLGEGFKKTDETAMGNSDPIILRTFLAILKNNYNLDPYRIRCELHIRADQDPEKIKCFWSKELGLPINNFATPIVDQRTVGSKTYPSYKGVCTLRCGNVAIQRKLLYLSKSFCNKIAEIKMGS